MLQKVYNSIEDLPVWNFLKVLKTDDKRYLLILDNYFDLPKVDDVDLFTAWQTIQTEIVDLNGISEEYTAHVTSSVYLNLVKHNLFL